MSLPWLRTVLTGCLLTATSQSLNAQDITVTLLGTGAPPPVMDRFGPSILVEAAGEKLIFDVGRGTAQRFFQLGMPLREVTGVFLTHFHSDHTVGLPDLWLTGWLNPQFGGRTAPFRIWGPPGTQTMMTALEEAYSEDIRIRIADQDYSPEGVAIEAKDIAEGVVFENEGVRVTAFNVDHGDLIEPAMGYRVDFRGRSVVLSGDTRVSENLIEFSSGVDLLVHEVAAASDELLTRSEGVRRIIAHHTRPEEAGAVFARVEPMLAVYSHIVRFGDAQSPPPSLEDVIASTRTAYSGPLEVGVDLMRIEIGDAITIQRLSPSP
jgi:ribonuclease Z